MAAPATLGRARALACLALALSGARRAEPARERAEPEPAPAAQRAALRLPMRTDGPRTLDPVQGATVYDHQACALVYDTLLDVAPGSSPSELQPLLLAEMPIAREENGRVVWRLRLRAGVRFHDDACFEGGRGRELVAADVAYSWKRMADERNLPRGWWLFEGVIQGFDEWRAAQARALAAGGSFDYDAPVSGLRLVSERELDVVLERPVYRFLWTLALFQTAIVAREAVVHHGAGFARHPVGTGPFRLESWESGRGMRLARNPSYHQVDERGRALPLAERVELAFFVEDQPMWLRFLAGELDCVQVPSESYRELFHQRSGVLRASWAAKGLQARAVPMLDFIFRGFDMEHPLLGGYAPERRALRQAIALAIDLEEFDTAFYGGTCVVYDGMIPPGLDGYPSEGRSPAAARGPDLERARERLAAAGYPGGEGLPVIEYWLTQGGNNAEQAELLERQLARIGVRLDVELVSFGQLMAALANRKAPFFSFAWASDYPDAENNLALFYGPNAAPGSNCFRYANPEFDALYERVRVLGPSPERTALYARMRDLVLADVPFVGSLARTRTWVAHPWLVGFEPSESSFGWIKHLDVDGSKRH